MFCPSLSITVWEAHINSTRRSANVESLTFALLCLHSSVSQRSQNKLSFPELPPQTRETHSNPNSGFSHLADTNRIFTSLVRRLVGSCRSIYDAEQEPPLVPSLARLLWRFKSFLSFSRFPNSKLPGFNGGTVKGNGARKKIHYEVEQSALGRVTVRGRIRIYHLNLPTKLIGQCQGIHKNQPIRFYVSNSNC